MWPHLQVPMTLACWCSGYHQHGICDWYEVIHLELVMFSPTDSQTVPLIPAPAPSSNSSQKPPQLFSHPINTRPQPQFRQKKKWVTLWVPSHNYKLYHTWVLITLDILLGPFRAYCHIYFHCKTVLKSNLWLTDTYTNIQSHYVNNLVNVSLTGFQLLWGELLPFARCSDAAWETDL